MNCNLSLGIKYNNHRRRQNEKNKLYFVAQNMQQRGFYIDFARFHVCTVFY